MYFDYNRKLTKYAIELRKNMTPEEQKLWFCYLSKLPLRFLRQKVINNYIVDFYCSKEKLVIEVDGSHHFTDKGMEYDEIRTEILEAHGLRVLRFTNSELKNKFRYVCEAIESELNNNPPVS